MDGDGRMLRLKERQAVSCGGFEGMGQLDHGDDWSRRMAPSLDEIEQLAIDAYAGLPAEFRALCGDILSLIHISEPRDVEESRMPSSA